MAEVVQREDGRRRALRPWEERCRVEMVREKTVRELGKAGGVGSFQ